MNDIVQGREGEGTRMGGGGGLESHLRPRFPHKEDRGGVGWRGWGVGQHCGEEAQALGQQTALPPGRLSQSRRECTFPEAVSPCTTLITFRTGA